MSPIVGFVDRHTVLFSASSFALNNGTEDLLDEVVVLSKCLEGLHSKLVTIICENTSGTFYLANFFFQFCNKLVIL